MTGEAIGAQPLAQAGLRRLATELEGPRPGGVREGAAAAPEETRTKRATRP